LEQKLSEGDLVFIRPSDVHYYEKYGENDCQFYNIPYKQKTMFDTFEYLGEDFNPQRLLIDKLPPAVELSPVYKKRLEMRLEKLFLMPAVNKHQIRIELRSILVEILTQYFPNHQQLKAEALPEWLDILIDKIQEKDVFTEGLPKVYEITNKSVVHINRSFKKYLNTTPSDFVNGVRLNYAQSLLIGTDRDILDISMDCGFNNLSHFYHLFKKQFNNTPALYRKRNRIAAV
jgi:AraC family cel operon transcriptional repressor